MPQMIREAVAVFDDPRRLDTAMPELRSEGFDRADISFLAPEAFDEGAVASLRRPAAQDVHLHDVPAGA